MTNIILTSVLLLSIAVPIAKGNFEPHYHVELGGSNKRIEFVS